MRLRRTAAVLAGALLALIASPSLARADSGSPSYPLQYPIIRIDRTVLLVGAKATVTVENCQAGSTATLSVTGPLTSPGVQSNFYKVKLNGNGIGTQQVIFSTVGRQRVSVICTAPDGSGPITAEITVTTSAAAVAPVIDPGVLGTQEGAGVGAATGTSLADLAHTGAALVGPLLLALGLLGGGTALVLLSSRRRKAS